MVEVLVEEFGDNKSSYVTNKVKEFIQKDENRSFQIKIPMKGDFESLNVSVAAGIILYEVIRQRMINEK